MYTREEISKQKQAFWTSLGRYMKPIPSADGEVISWINYKTGIKGISFKMDVDRQQASIAIIMTPSYYEQFLQLKNILTTALEEDDWTWLPDSTDEYGKPISSISKTLHDVNIFRNEDWPAIISFLKPRIVSLDTFWSMVKDGFNH